MPRRWTLVGRGSVLNNCKQGNSYGRHSLGTRDVHSQILPTSRNVSHQLVGRSEYSAVHTIMWRTGYRHLEIRRTHLRARLLDRWTLDANIGISVGSQCGSQIGYSILSEKCNLHGFRSRSELDSSCTARRKSIHLVSGHSFNCNHWTWRARLVCGADSSSQFLKR